MKKVLLVGAIALFGAVNAQTAGNFKLGAHIGLPVGDSSSSSSVLIGADAAYLWPVASEFNLGLATGYSAWIGKSGYDTLSMIPLAAAAEYKISPQFSLGVDLGYGFLFSNGDSTGGFYFQPKAAYHFGPSEVYVGYLGVSKTGYNAGAINLGYAYSFGQ
ncbi:hypothetical protein [Chryseobacterium salivictor]|uniref:Outer membrane protein beta-barrel domain-containing protein n=1 Tax=Chryseobacterium salivictor TaxID=2547600 RepID=A0A4P6ZIC1_9FLAO|nr:hypothetical protein [Chryseobacterium salivictor]QBO59449.1 hypothetical protein NBC122_02647 [Chryseobacterium salivictor]